MGLNLSNQQIAQELDLDKDDVYQMTCLLREEIMVRKPLVRLQGEVECDELYVTAGHKGQPEAVKKKVALDDATDSKGFGVGALKRKKSRRFLG